METEFNSENKNRLRRRDQQEAVGDGRASGVACQSPLCKGRVQNNPAGALGFCHIVRLAVSTGIVDCGGLILKERGERV